MTPDDWGDRARRLADELDHAGVLDQGWRAAFEQVPRHVFVPGFFADRHTWLDGSDPARRAEWLDAVYSDDTLVTQQIRVSGIGLDLPTSSSTAPSLMARMLDLLDITPADRVLEIGTGTGYNAALLCHRLGDEHVTSIEIDPALVDLARDRLASLGHHPHLVAGDGALGVPDRAPFTRLIATAAVGSIPGPWAAQLAPGGIAVIDVRGELTSSLVVAHKAADRLEGLFLAQPGRFMWLRAHAGNPLRHGGTMNSSYDMSDATTVTTTISLDDLTNPEFWFLLEFLVPELRWTTIDGNTRILAPDNSWAQIEESPSDTHEVTYGGPTEFWSHIAAAHHRWDELGRPDRIRFGLTAHVDGRQHLWLDEPTNVVAGQSAGPFGSSTPSCV